MLITVNGEKMTLANEVKTIAELVKLLNLDPNRFFMIEKNGEVVLKEEYAREAVQDNDRFEIVHFVGGG